MRRSRSSSSKSSFALIVEVRQAGVVQCTAVLPPSQREKSLTFGKNRKCDLTVEFGGVPDHIALFRSVKNELFVLIEPRVTGFVNSGTEFGTVAEFLSPEGAISPLATISDPYAVRLEKESRGVLRLGEFEVLFKVARPPAAEKPQFVMKGAKGSFLAPPPVDSRYENSALWMGLLCVVMLFGPAVFWLMKAPHSRISSLSSLPDQFLIQFVHPEHFRYLPKIFEDEYRYKDSVKQAVTWVSELQKRWDAEDQEESYTSVVPILGAFSRQISSDHLDRRWAENREKQFAELEGKRTAPGSDRFYRFQSAYPEIVADTAGGSAGSLYLRHLKRIHDLDKAYQSLREIVLQEQRFLNSFFEQRGVQREGFFSEPSSESEVVEIEDIDSAFSEERDKYAYAEGWARLAERSMYWPTTAQISEFRDGQKHLRPSVLWLKKSSIISPAFLSRHEGRSSDPEKSLLKNAMYSDRLIQIPPPPRPQPVIDRAKVEYVIVDRREEVRGCYENALRRDSQLEGHLRLSWWVQLGGRARNVRVVSSSINSPQLIHCVENLLLNWRFPKPRHGAVKVEYPFRFLVE